MPEDRNGLLVELGKRLDEVIPGPVYSTGRRIYYDYLGNKYLNRIRRERDFLWLYVRSRIHTCPSDLHLGCGRDRTDMCDIDLVKTPATDYVLDAGRLPFPDDSIEKIETYHMVEHVPRDNLGPMLSEWARILEPGGELIIELPDFDEVLHEYLETSDNEYTETLLRYIFGSQRFDSDYHYWGWNGKRLGQYLREHSFSNIERKEPTDNHAEEAPCMRVVATPDKSPD